MLQISAARLRTHDPRSLRSAGVREDLPCELQSALNEPIRGKAIAG